MRGSGHGFPDSHGNGEFLSPPYWTFIDGSVVSGDQPHIRVTQEAYSGKQSVANDSPWARSSLLLLSYVLLGHVRSAP